MRTTTIIDNYVNGNLSDACKQAKKVSATNLTSTMIEEYGWSLKRSYAVTNYLKHPSNETFDAACKAEAEGDSNE